MQMIETPVGKLAAVWSSGGLYSCEFWSKAKTPSLQQSAYQPSPDQMSTLESAVDEYFATGLFGWDLDDLDWSGVSVFHRRVLEVCFAIESGNVKSYGALAALAGSPKAARAVGSAMARNRWPILIPCHRVVGASGALTGYSGVGGIDTKQSLLSMEREFHDSRLVCNV